MIGVIEAGSKNLVRSISAAYRTHIYTPIVRKRSQVQKLLWLMSSRARGSYGESDAFIASVHGVQTLV
jgi:hypothetical protein